MAVMCGAMVAFFICIFHAVSAERQLAIGAAGIRARVGIARAVVALLAGIDHAVAAMRQLAVGPTGIGRHIRIPFAVIALLPFRALQNRITAV